MRIGPYKLLAPLGAGGMGVVYEAEDTRLGRHVALKLLSAEACCVPEAMDRFLREARIVSSLSHPHICTLHDIGEFEGQQFMVMELLEGESMKDRIARGALPLDDVLDLGVQIADALDAAHSAGVVHRDVKPANLFVTRRGQAKVLDFGVAKLADRSEGDKADATRTATASDLTTAGSAVGTVAYMSPEQARGQEIDARSDLFSFGLVLYEMATGRQAFPGPTPAVIFEGILTRQPQAVSYLNASMPPELDRIISKALEKDRETRYQTASEMRADLKRLKRETDTGRTAAMTAPFSGAGPTPPSSAQAAVEPAALASPPAARARSARRAWLFGVPVATAVAVGAIWLWQSQRAPALTMRDTVVLADFGNRTGDTMFDDTLGEALAVQLRQSPFLNLLPEQQVQATLQMMGRGAMDPLTPEVAREVCQRTGAKAMLGGTIAGLGTSYIVTLSAQNCVTGEVLAEEQVNASSKERVITALGSAAASFRERLGESLDMVQRYDANIEMATTPSLEALKAYSQGMLTRRTRGDFDAVPFFRRAIDLDPTFAIAHARLGTVLSNLGERPEAEKAAARAFELRDRVSERERLYIEARYHTTVARDQLKAIEAYRLLLATYPDDYAAHSNIGSLYGDRGMSKEALTHLEEAVRLAPLQPFGHINLGFAYLRDARVDDARREFDEVLKLQPSATARIGLYTLATITGDRALADAQVAAVRGTREETEVMAAQVQGEAFHGRMKESARLADDLFRRNQTVGRLAVTAEAFVGHSINQALIGNAAAARPMVERLRRAGVLDDALSAEMVVLGWSLRDRQMVQGQMARAIERARRTHPPVEADKMGQSFRALAALTDGRYQEAYDLAAPLGVERAHHSALYVTGLAALGLRRWDDATKALTAFTADPSRIGMSPMVAVGHIMLGRAHAGAGRTADARKAYEVAFQIWRDADADLPLLVEARREYDRLP
jgi:tetratricopeptide (TPR) repeat protein